MQSRNFDGAAYAAASTYPGEAVAPNLLAPCGGTLEGFFCYAGKKHDGGNAILFNGEREIDLGIEAYGGQGAPCCFGPDGLYVSTVGAANNVRVFNRKGVMVRWFTQPIGVQGIAQIVNGTPIPASDQYGGNGFGYYAIFDAIQIGQGAFGGLVARIGKGPLKMLEPGPWEMLSYGEANATISVAASQFHYFGRNQHRAVARWITRADIEAAPLAYVDPTLPGVPSPVPVPPKPPEPKPVSHPSQLGAIESIRTKYPTPLGLTHPAFLIEVAQTLGVLLFKKDSGTHVTLPNGANVSQDIIVYADDHEGFDILNDGEGAAKATWSSKGTMTGEFVSVSPIVGPAPPPVSTVGGRLDDALALLGKQIELFKGALAAQGAMIETLRAKLDGAGSSDQVNGAKVAFRTGNGKYLCAEGGGGGEVNATRDAAGGWETFTLERR